MGSLKVSFHDHPLLPCTRFSLEKCYGCPESCTLIYGGYFCNEVGCHNIKFHKECAESLPVINVSSHPDHPLHLVLDLASFRCRFCGELFRDVGYSCSKCDDFKLHLGCARRPPPLLTLENPNLHEHSLLLFDGTDVDPVTSEDFNCKVCGLSFFSKTFYYRCHQCQLVFNMECVSEAYATSHHPQHPLKFLCEVPDYTYKKCLLCLCKIDQRLHHCDVCNLSICGSCMTNPPPHAVVSPTTHEHELHLVQRLIDFTCDSCGTQGNGSPYYCLQCNFMIHRDCIDLPRVININRHDHRISYTRRIGLGKWSTCGVCRKEVDGFYGAYTCSRCPSYVVHARCATSSDVWEQRELEDVPEEEELEPFEVVDDMTIKHFSHNHNLIFNKDGKILPENTLCEACVFQVYPESFYSCKECKFVIHDRCANLTRKKRHVCYNQPLTLRASSHRKAYKCDLCAQVFTGMRYQSPFGKMLDVRCGSFSEPFVHECHPHPLFYYSTTRKDCSACDGKHQEVIFIFGCDDCDFSLDFWCAFLPKKVTRQRYDDHPLFLSYGDQNNTVDGDYWCEACETKVNPKKWFYTCIDCGVVLHTSCVVGDLSYLMPGYVPKLNRKVVVPNTSICRHSCASCKSRCKLPSVLKVTDAGVDAYFCSFKCSLEYSYTFLS